ncbi:MAG: glycosyltransferase family 2 protein [Slackia sp.]|nr:glycosyltransferase family 2 protein [Slackia sp.]
MSRPLVSLLVPIYNVERYLRECLDSACSQTLRDIEIICINDGSTDSSPDIIREYMQRDERVRMIDKANSGYGASMNKGLAAAQGRYIGILESDDFFEEDALEVLVAAAEKHDAQVVKANFWLYWSVPEEKNELFEIVDEDMADRPVNPTEEPGIFYAKPSIWSALYRRDFLEEHGIRFLETPGASFQDSAFNFKVWASAERVAFVRDAVLHYRQDNESSSVNSPSKVYCICDEHAEMDRFLDEHPEKQVLRGVKEKVKLDNYLWNYERLASPLDDEFLQRMHEEFKADLEAGHVDFEVFEPWKKEDFLVICESPELFKAGRASSNAKGAISKARCYVQEGGISLLVKGLARKTKSR